MSWFSDIFGKEKIIIASLYLPPLPGNPDIFKGLRCKRSLTSPAMNYTNSKQEGWIRYASVINKIGLIKWG